MSELNYYPSIKKELASHIVDLINDGVLNNENKEDWHYYAFNQDYYIVYHSRAVQWLKTHELDAFEAISIVKDYEVSNFGGMNTEINPEAIVNMVAYIFGEELIHSEEFKTVASLKKAMRSIINSK